MAEHQAEATTPPPTDEVIRRFQVADAMILVAALAVGFAFAKIAFDGAYPGRVPSAFRLMYAVEAGHAAACPCVASLAVACLLLRLRGPRPPFLRMVMQPGFAACCVAVVQLLTVGLMSAILAPEISLASFTSVLSPVVAMGVLMAWWVLLLNGWWRSEHGWIDRMGRVLGVCWIVLLFIDLFALWL